MNQEQQKIKVIHLSDPHLFSDPNGRLAGMNTRESLLAVLDHIRQHHLPFDLLLVTGDIAHDATLRQTYALFFQLLADLNVPVLTLPGNHDDNQTMKEAISACPFATMDYYHFRGWDFILLDSSVTNNTFGLLSRDELDRLESTLSGSGNVPTLIALHHQPVSLGSKWINALGLLNSRAFFDCIDRHRHVKGVVWGHIHQNYAAERNGVALFSPPSTCIQFNAHQHAFSLDRQAPGYRWYSLAPDGTISSGIERTSFFPDNIDFSMNGYE